MKKKTRAKASSISKAQPAVRGNTKEASASAQGFAARLANLFSGQPNDIVGAIKEDHAALRSFLKTLKDTDEDMQVRRRAYSAFTALLQSHSAAEEKAVYDPTLKMVGREMHLKVTEGFVEHRLADDLMARIKKIKNPMDWSAHVNVISEIVEHHLKEEESDLLPLIRKTATPEQNAKMLNQFVALREKTQKKVSPKNAGVLK